MTAEPELCVCLEAILCALPPGKENMLVPSALRGVAMPVVGRAMGSLLTRTATLGGAAAALIQPQAAMAEVEGAVPDDSLVVGFALFLLVCTGLLNLSLGDIAADEAQLPSSVNLINKSRARRSSFIKGGKDGSSM